MAFSVALVAGPLTYEVGTHKFVRGQKAVTIQDGDPELVRFKSDRNFSCERIGPPPAPAKAFKKGAKSKAPVEDDEEELDGDEEDEASEDEGESDEASGVLTRAELKKLKKEELVKMASESGIEVDAGASKSAVIDAILEASGEDEDDDG